MPQTVPAPLPTVASTACAGWRVAGALAADRDHIHSVFASWAARAVHTEHFDVTVD
jgi:hypothetical protein